MYILKILDSSLFFFMYMSMNFFILFAFISTFHALLLASNCVTEKCFQKPSNMARLIRLLHKNAKCTCNYIQNDMFAYFSSCQCVYNTAFAFLCSVYMFFVRCILFLFLVFSYVYRTGFHLNRVLVKWVVKPGPGREFWNWKPGFCFYHQKYTFNQIEIHTHDSVYVYVYSLTISAWNIGYFSKYHRVLLFSRMVK